MLDRILNNRFLVLYISPFCLGLMAVLSFQPFNLSFINFISFPIFVFLIV